MNSDRLNDVTQAVFFWLSDWQAIVSTDQQLHDLLAFYWLLLLIAFLTEVLRIRVRLLGMPLELGSSLSNFLPAYFI